MPTTSLFAGTQRLGTTAARIELLRGTSVGLRLDGEVLREGSMSTRKDPACAVALRQSDAFSDVRKYKLS